jgi:hypothetical protein
MLEEMYQQYLEMTGLAGKELPRNQAIETKRAFAAGCASTLKKLVNVAHEHSKEEATKIFDGFEIELQDYWQKEADNAA